MTKEEFWIESFLTAAPTLLDNAPWTRGNEQLNSMLQQVQLCSEFADQAVEQAQKRNMLARPKPMKTTKTTTKPQGKPNPPRPAST